MGGEQSMSEVFRELVHKRLREGPGSASTRLPSISLTTGRLRIASCPGVPKFCDAPPRVAI